MSLLKPFIWSEPMPTSPIAGHRRNTRFPAWDSACAPGTISVRNFKDGFEIYGRIPIGFTTYVLSHFGIHFELGIGYGITGIITKDITLADLVANQVCQEINTQTQGVADCQAQDSGLRISHGFLIDLSVGFRFP